MFGKNEWEEKYLSKEEFMPKILNESFLSELGHAHLTHTENELLNKNFKLEALNNTETKEEYNKLLNRISDRATIFKKLMKAVSNPVEKKKN